MHLFRNQYVKKEIRKRHEFAVRLKGKTLLCCSKYNAQFTKFSCVLYRKMNQTVISYSILYNINLNQIINYFILSYYKIIIQQSVMIIQYPIMLNQHMRDAYNMMLACEDAQNVITHIKQVKYVKHMMFIILLKHGSKWILHICPPPHIYCYP